MRMGSSYIVEISLVKANVDGSVVEVTHRVRPARRVLRDGVEVMETVKIPPETTAVHHITDADVADKPTFRELAPEILAFIGDADLAGYNSNKFDVPLLVEEFLRIEMDFDLRGIRIIDVQNIFHKMEPRTLVAAYKFYCGKPLANAHSAEADARATLEVLESQLDRYQDVPYVDANEVECYPVVNDISKLAFFSNVGHNVDLAGHIIWNNKDQEVFAFGKHKGEPVREVFRNERNYYDWMMKADFPLYTKKVITRIYRSTCRTWGRSCKKRTDSYNMQTKVAFALN